MLLGGRLLPLAWKERSRPPAKGGAARGPFLFAFSRMMHKQCQNNATSGGAAGFHQ